MPLNDAEKTFYVQLLKLRDPAKHDPTIPHGNFFWILDLAEDDLGLTPADVTNAHLKRFKAVSVIVNPQFMPDPKAKAQRCVNEAKRKLTTEAALQQHRDDLRIMRTNALEAEARAAEGVSDWKAFLTSKAKDLGFPTSSAIQQAVQEVIVRLQPKPPVPYPPPGPRPWHMKLYGTIWHSPLQVRGWSIPRWIWAVFLAVLLVGLIHATAGVVAGLSGAVVSAILACTTRHRQLHISWGASALTGVTVLVILAVFGTTQDPGTSLTVGVVNATPPQNAPANALLAIPSSCSAPGKTVVDANQLLLAIDGDAKTAWITPNAVSGDWFELGFPEPLKIDGIGLMNSEIPGVGKNTSAHLHKARLVFDSGPSLEIEFDDKAGWQIKPFDVRTTAKVRLEVLSTYPDASKSTKAGFAEVWCYVGDAPLLKTNWAGLWDTSWGDMNVHQTGRWFFADFKANRRRIIAKLFYDGRLVGSWSQPPTHQPPQDAGSIELKFDSTGSLFQTRLRNGFSGPWQSEDPLTCIQKISP